MGWTDAVILGLVEGITEYLPISSTGHLLITNEVLKLNSEVPMLDESGAPLMTPDGEAVTLKTAADAYAIVIQAGAILAVLFLYWSRVWQVILGVLGLSPNGRLLARNLIVAFLPAAVLGLLLDDWIESMLFAPLPIAIALIVGGFLMLAVESWRKHQLPDDDDIVDLHTLGVRQSLFIGFMQCIAMWPGTSRSMMTIVGGYVAGLRPTKAAEFSFLLGLITLTAAAGYKAVSSGPALFLAIDMGPLLLGIFVAFVSAALAVKWLVSYLTRHGLAIFAWYRFVLAGLVIFFLVR
ncbi:undecaprenyl-diphosphate phosphatase [Puniceicoccales bacterium CK1056]|uniref:Undecaprenyl-diphosphatase n=1 Tax=Oceanipulchritudo coccoides TaxID=2706888 RepID=A0A6B2M3R8_9BACT|nr:undecaprenyl-diphosphate phosphatase [Oceanipulchritudo coccoides]